MLKCTSADATDLDTISLAFLVVLHWQNAGSVEEFISTFGLDAVRYINVFVPAYVRVRSSGRNGSMRTKQEQMQSVVSLRATAECSFIRGRQGWAKDTCEQMFMRLSGELPKNLPIS